MPGWNVTLGPSAKRDLADIVKWTKAHFGVEQAAEYRPSSPQRSAKSTMDQKLPDARIGSLMEPNTGL
jgi:plasmid stabilization system protein ParE